jgi:hypothetical protein
MAPSARHRQPSHNLFRYHIRACGDLLRCLVLYRMLHVNGVESRASQRAGLNARWRCEFSCSHRHRGNAQIFQTDRVVQTARCARPSIRQTFYNSIHRPQLFDNLRRSIL